MSFQSTSTPAVCASSLSISLCLSLRLAIKLIRGASILSRMTSDDVSHVRCWEQRRCEGSEAFSGAGSRVAEKEAWGELGRSFDLDGAKR